jgi:hypothetical protein
VRTDAGARKIIERLDDMRDQMTEVKAASVRWDKLIVLLGSAATVIVGGAWRVAVSQNEQSERRLLQQIIEVRGQILELQEMKAYVKGAYQVSVEQKPRAKVAEEVRSQLDGGL